MIESLSVKNFALIKEAHIDFRDNLNVITGETGSGKSILIGSINLALGMRANKDYLRDDNEEMSVAISFDVKSEELKKYIEELDIPMSDDKVIIYRKVTKDKNVVKINDEPCTLNKIKDLTEKLIDIYGQHDSESLRKNARHIEFLDDFIGNEVSEKKKNILEHLTTLKAAREKLDTFNLDEKMRLREIDILKYEIEELENAHLKEGEEEELADKFKLASNSKNIIEALTTAFNSLQESRFDYAVKEVKDAMKYDSSLSSIYESLTDVENIVRDSIKELDKRISGYDIDEKEFKVMEDRLDFIRRILSKYGNSIDSVISQLAEKKERLNSLINYESEKKKAEEKVEKCEKKLYSAASELSELRKQHKKSFIDKLLFELRDIGFTDAKFDIDINEKQDITKDGFDDVVFMISLNAGEKLRPLSEVASGGELSRIMLSIKTILSDTYGTETLIFDEIDAGISGITATKVAAKLNRIAKNHQVILITHLPQIAAMADNHFVIEKKVDDNRTLTTITELTEDGMIEEIGRLISSGGTLTETVLANAKELKELARLEKKK